jgi:hypothetical protein
LDLNKKIYSNRSNKVGGFQPKVALENIKSIQEAKNDIVAFNIYYEDVSYTYVSEVPALDMNSLLSSYGKVYLIFFYF